MRRTHEGPYTEMTDSQRISRRTEVERATKEDPIDRTHERSPVAAHGRERQKSHPTQTITGRARTKAAFARDHLTQVLARSLIALVEEYLEAGNILISLMHPPTSAEQWSLVKGNHLSAERCGTPRCEPRTVQLVYPGPHSVGADYTL